MTIQQTRAPDIQQTREPEDIVSHATPTRNRGSLTIVVVAVVALLLGGLGGWFVRGSSDDPDAVVAGGSELTQRQEDMLEMFYDYTDAMLANDGAAAVALFVPTGTWSGDFGDRSVEDGSIEAFVDTFNFQPPMFSAPILVDGDRLHYVHEYMDGSYYDAVTFTSTGDLKIINHRWLD